MHTILSTMWRIQRSLQAILTALLLGCLTVVQLTPIVADAADAPSLIIGQLKITSSNGQFITLYNATGMALDASKYQLQYFNNYDLSKATSSKLIALSGIVPPHGYLMVSDGPVLLCYQLLVNSVSLGLSSTAGLVEVLAFNQSNPGGSANPVLQDYVGWSKTPASGAQTLPGNTSASLQRQPTDTVHNPIVAAPGAGSWLAVQPDPADSCKLVNSSSGEAISPVGSSQLLLPLEPPSTVIADPASTAAGPSMPAADIGLMSPMITELLPNPIGTGNDSTDEFIELYNPNTTPFDLNSFNLESGLSTKRSFTFPAGTTLPAQSYTAFYARTTGLSLSNTSSQVQLLDPFGKSIATAATYSNAKDGIAWALAKGKWYWTTSPTPGKPNVVHQPSTKKTAAKSSAKRSVAGVKGASKTAATAGSYSQDDPTATPIHVRMLALVIGAALLYGAYEYRTDVANRIHRFRQYLGDRHADRT